MLYEKNNSLSIVIVLVVIGAITYFGYSLYNNIPADYFAVLSDGAFEQTYHTYFYIDKLEMNRTRYIQTTSTIVSWGSDKWEEKVTKKGDLVWPEDVFDVAHENNSRGWITINQDIGEKYKTGDIITEEQFLELISIK